MLLSIVCELHFFVCKKISAPFREVRSGRVKATLSRDHTNRVSSDLSQHLDTTDQEDLLKQSDEHHGNKRGISLREVAAACIKKCFNLSIGTMSVGRR